MTHILAVGGTLHGQLRCIQSLYSSQPTLVNLPTTTYLTSPKKSQELKFEENPNQGDIWTIGRESITTVVVLSESDHYWQSY